MKGESYFENILLPVDGSHQCLHAEELAVTVAKKFRSKVTMVHVVPHAFLHPREPHPMPEAVAKEITGWFLQHGKKVVGEAEMLFRTEGIEVNAELIEYADPAETIIQKTESGKYDLVVIGNRGESEAETFSLGSVADKVSRHAECPVLIVKEKTKISKVLVGIDGSENAEKALEHAVELAEKHKAKVTLLNVQESKIFGLKPEVAKELGDYVLSDAAAKVKGVEFKTLLEFGNPAETIIEVAEKGNYDLIVVGNRGLSSVKRFFLGSVSDDISHHAKCSVLIVR